MIVRDVPSVARSDAHSRPAERRLRIVVASTYVLEPALHGGQRRARSLYEQIARFADVEVVALTDDLAPSRGVAQAGFVQTLVPRSPRHAAREGQLCASAGLAVGDVAFTSLIADTPAYLDALRSALDGADIAFCCQPYVHPAVRAVWSGPIVYDSQNVEAALKRAMYPPSELAEQLAALVEQLEAACVRDAALVCAISAADAAAYAAAYALPDGRAIAIPPGAAAEPFRFGTRAQRTAARLAAGLTSPIAIFVGSHHGPNYEAVRAIAEIGPQVPQVTFLAAGGASTELAKLPRRPNLHALGVISDADLEQLLGVADLALNPVSTAGGGVNMKMIDYVMHGIPVVTHPTGVRGLPFEHERHLLVCSNDALAGVISTVLTDPVAAEARAVRAYGALLASQSWTASIAPLRVRLQALCVR